MLLNFHAVVFRQYKKLYCILHIGFISSELASSNKCSELISFHFLFFFQNSYWNSWTLNARVRRWTLDVGLWTLDSGRWTLDAGLWTLDSGRWTLDAGLLTLDSGHWTLDAGLWTFDSGLWTLSLTVVEQNQNLVSDFP